MKRRFLFPSLMVLFLVLLFSISGCYTRVGRPAISEEEYTTEEPQKEEYYSEEREESDQPVYNFYNYYYADPWRWWPYPRYSYFWEPFYDPFFYRPGLFIDIWWYGWYPFHPYGFWYDVYLWRPYYYGYWGYPYGWAYRGYYYSPWWYEPPRYTVIEPPRRRDFDRRGARSDDLGIGGGASHPSPLVAAKVSDGRREAKRREVSSLSTLEKSATPAEARRERPSRAGAARTSRDETPWWETRLGGNRERMKPRVPDERTVTTRERRERTWGIPPERFRERKIVIEPRRERTDTERREDTLRRRQRVLQTPFIEMETPREERREQSSQGKQRREERPSYSPPSEQPRSSSPPAYSGRSSSSGQSSSSGSQQRGSSSSGSSSRRQRK